MLCAPRPTGDTQRERSLILAWRVRSRERTMQRSRLIRPWWKNFPAEPIAVDAQYQIGYIWFTAAQLGTNDAAAAGNAKTAFQDFLFHYPKSEKAAQARKDLDLLEHKQTNNSFKVAKFY